MGKISYTRGTTYTITHTYQKNGVPSNDGAKLYFTVKPTAFDSDPIDSAAIFQIPVTMSGAVNLINILPTTVPDTVAPSNYFYDIKVIETDPTKQYVVDSGSFTLKGSPTNKVS